MKLTQKDKDFLEKLAILLGERQLEVAMACDGCKRMVLRKNYGDKIEKEFGMTRQGVRWRFQRLMDLYVSGLEGICFVESNLGVRLRPMALEIARERVRLRKKAQKLAQNVFCRRDKSLQGPDSYQSQ